VFTRADTREPAQDVELALYSGFLPDADKRLLRAVRETPPEQLGSRAFPFSDPRYAELLFRYRARNWPDQLAVDERERWRAFRQRRLQTPSALTTLTDADYFATIAQLRLDPARKPGDQALLDALDAWGRDLLERLAD
jgi:exodeoxyribonuclease-1